MQSAALLRAQLETSLAERAPSAFRLRVSQAPELLPTGTPELDALLGGGIPRGRITEITGTSTTGRTSLALSILARATGLGIGFDEELVMIVVSDTTRAEQTDETARQAGEQRLREWFRQSSWPSVVGVIS